MSIISDLLLLWLNFHSLEKKKSKHWNIAFKNEERKPQFCDVEYLKQSILAREKMAKCHSTRGAKKK